MKLFELGLLSILMGATSYLAGLAPLKIPLASKHLNLISVFSMGMLIGTSLVIVIPEGIDTLDESSSNLSHSVKSRYIGISLLFGFMIMYLIDNSSTILSNFNIKYDVNQAHRNYDSQLEKFKSIFKSPLTLGLIFHSAVDGISLGSSFSKDDITIGVIFFIMIIIHKLPTAFSLTTLLAKSSLPGSFVKLHLIVFSLITPISALLTYILFLLLNLENEFAISILLLFSGGTFLYIVTHVMLEILSDDKDESNYRPPSNESEETVTNHVHSKLTNLELGISLLGMIIPILMSFIGDH